MESNVGQLERSKKHRRGVALDDSDYTAVCSNFDEPDFETTVSSPARI